MEKKRIVIYVALAYGLAWALWFAVVYPMVNGGGLGTSVQFAIAAGMFAPAIAAALTRLITKEGFKDAWIKPRAFKKTWRYRPGAITCSRGSVRSCSSSPAPCCTS